MLSKAATQMLRSLDREASTYHGDEQWTDEQLQFHVLQEVAADAVEAAAQGDVKATLILRWLFGLPALV